MLNISKERKYYSQGNTDCVAIEVSMDILGDLCSLKGKSHVVPLLVGLFISESH